MIEGDYTLAKAYEDIQRLADLILQLPTTGSILSDIPLLAELDDWVVPVAGFVQDLLSSDALSDFVL